MNMGDLRAAVAANRVLEIGTIIGSIQDVPTDVAIDYVRSMLGYVPPSHWRSRQGGKENIGTFNHLIRGVLGHKFAEGILVLDFCQERVVMSFDDVQWECHKLTLPLRRLALRELEEQFAEKEPYPYDQPGFRSDVLSWINGCIEASTPEEIDKLTPVYCAPITYGEYALLRALYERNSVGFLMEFAMYTRSSKFIPTITVNNALETALITNQPVTVEML